MSSLLFGNAWAERELSEVAANSNASGLNHLGFVFGESGGVELLVVHVADMASLCANFVVVLNNRVEDVTESGVGVGGASVDTDSGISVFAAGEDSLLEGETVGVNLVLVVLPHVLGKVFVEQRSLFTVLEGGETGQVVGGFEVRADSYGHFNLDFLDFLDHLFGSLLGGFLLDNTVLGGAAGDELLAGVILDWLLPGGLVDLGLLEIILRFLLLGLEILFKLLGLVLLLVLRLSQRLRIREASGSEGSSLCVTGALASAGLDGGCLGTAVLGGGVSSEVGVNSAAVGLLLDDSLALGCDQI